MVRRRINRIKRTYTRARGGLSTIFQNPAIVGTLAGIFKNVANGQPPINVASIQRRITQPNAKNPLIYFILGHILKNKPLQAIGAFQIVDPPVSEDDVDDMSDEEIEALSEEIEADEGEENTKIYIH